ncbi:MAG: nicotinate-nucleotide--dimethylbenzimidazole phosphoribosyltransferase [Hydrogenophilales bacterium 28-61-23]|nr:MAG: nicotinate-nucleotide--dimethylbenzimidazole phosphoribosyltransferase [Hydrogenophilales bacterium 28-61-23]
MTYWWQHAVKPLDEAARAMAGQRQNSLTKPPGSLGRLEEIAIHLAAMQGREKPQIERPAITIFAGDHGVVAEGVAAFPQAVTQQMLANFVAGGAAISVLAKALGARLEVVDVGTLAGEAVAGVVRDKTALGTASLAQAPAMTPVQLNHALAAGQRATQRALAASADMFIGGDMGIGNTTAAAALSCALLDLTGAQMAGPGTGLDAAGVSHKATVIDRALALHGFLPSPPAPPPLAGEGSIAVLRCLGGFEIAALAGAYIACAQAGLPVLVDGFIATAAALAACRMNPAARDWMLFAHASAEPGHARLLAALEARPLLQLDMRLGEGSGAATALPLLRLACELHAGMATFAEAGVSRED